MLKPCFAALAIVLTLAPSPTLAQPGDPTKPMRTPDGQPDVSGTFSPVVPTTHARTPCSA